MCEAGFEIISKLRKDANLRYLYNGKIKSGRGRNKKYGDKINLNTPELEKFNKDYQTDELKLFGMIIQKKDRKRTINCKLYEKKGNKLGIN